MAITAHHVGLTVADIDRSQAWYGKALGFELQLGFELPDGVRGAMLAAAGGARMELFEVRRRGGTVVGRSADAMRERGFGHVALEASDLDASYAQAIGAGAISVWEPRQSPEPGRRMAFIHDPDGNLIELIGPRE